MDDTDRKLLAALRADARASLSDLAGRLGVTRGTVRARLERLQASGEIVGFTVRTRGDAARDPVRALTLIAIEGPKADRVARQLAGFAELRALHSTNGRWDLIAELGTEGLAALDAVLSRVRRLDGVVASETSLMLATRRQD